jgi:hypothetical protein
MTPAVLLPEALERAAVALERDADAIRPANGDPTRLAASLGKDAGARVLAWLLAELPSAGAELADAWSELGGDAALAVLAVSEDALPKAGRKALRRARHRLRSQGVAVAAPAAQPVVAKLPPVAGDRLDEALVSPLDPTGMRMAYLVTSHPSGGARIFEILLDEQRGIAEFQLYATGRSEVRRFVRQFTRNARFPGVAAEPEAVKALIARAASRQPSERPFPRGFAEWRGKLAPNESALAPGAQARAALGSELSDAALERVATRIREGAIGPWPPHGDALTSLAARFEELRTSALVVAEHQREEQARAAIAEALPGVFAAAYCGICADRFEEAAHVAWKREQEGEARDLLAAAEAFRTRAGDHPVARAMLDAVCAPVLARLREARASEASGAGRLVTPAS